MKKGEVFQRITISEPEYEQLIKAERKVGSVKVLKRIQAFKLIYLGWKYTAIAKFLSVTNNTLTNWVNLYREGGVDSILTLCYKGGQARLNDEQLLELKNEAAKGSFAIAKDVRRFIKQNYGIEYNLSHVQLLCKKKFNYPLRKPD